jgi:hypothetical protein
MVQIVIFLFINKLAARLPRTKNMSWFVMTRCLIIRTGESRASVLMLELVE